MSRQYDFSTPSSRSVPRQKKKGSHFGRADVAIPKDATKARYRIKQRGTSSETRRENWKERQSGVEKVLKNKSIRATSERSTGS
jgi:hypothetical protein